MFLAHYCHKLAGAWHIRVGFKLEVHSINQHECVPNQFALLLAANKWFMAVNGGLYNFTYVIDGLLSGLETIKNYK